VTSLSVSQRRQRVIVAGHEGRSDVVLPFANDADASVREATLRALQRCGALTPETHKIFCTDPSARVRRAAAEVAAKTRLPDLPILLSDEDNTVVEVACWALGEWANDGAIAVEHLSAIARDHDDSLCRESAVAALGAIGDIAGLPAILEAMNNKAAVRRRAAIALAAFDTVEAEEALNKALEDRDWQVRQIAEDLV
jgi:HEAT repeat protein